MKNIHIAASLLAADPLDLKRDVQAVLDAGADSLHIDIMDNHYVPNLALAPSLCSALKQAGIQAPLQVHLMTFQVDTLIPLCADQGASSLCFHPETSLHVDRTLSLIRQHGCQAGLALNPGTSLCVLDHVWDKVDWLLIMSVNPGFCGQTWMPHTVDKLNQIRQCKGYLKYQPKLFVDGGINTENAPLCQQAGAYGLVVGSALFNAKDYAQYIRALKQA